MCLPNANVSLSKRVLNLLVFGDYEKYIFPPLVTLNSLLSLIVLHISAMAIIYPFILVFGVSLYSKSVCTADSQLTC